MEKLVTKLESILPDITFLTGNAFYWSPQNKTIRYVPRNDIVSTWSILHEAAHALLQHKNYNSDYELLHLEVAAWEEAKELGKQLKVTIDENHIQDCLDTYRDWLHQRSTCPTCSSVSFQSSVREYRCHNCYTIWQVSNSRFCRPYRLRTTSKQPKKPSGEIQTTFS